VGDLHLPWGSRVRILHVIPSIDPATGGPAEGLKQFCKIYRAGGHDVEVASLDSPAFAGDCPFPAPVIGLGPGVGVFGYSHKLLVWLRANRSRFDVVIVNAIWQYNAVAVHRALAGTGIPYAVFTHGMLDPYFRQRFPLKHLKKVVYWFAILRRIMEDASTVFFTSEEERLLARQSFAGYKVRETVIPYGTFGADCDTARAEEAFLAQWPHLQGKRVALCLGRIHRKKATDILIEAFASTLARDSEWHLVIAGPDQTGWQTELQALANRLGIEDRITWTGMLQGDLKWGALSSSEIFVLPSHQENFGIVVAEALSCGLPVVISSKVNIWREVESYGAGMVGKDTLEGTRDSLERWSRLQPGEIAEFQSNGRKCFDEQFNFNVTARKLLDTIASIAATNTISAKPS